MLTKEKYCLKKELIIHSLIKYINLFKHEKAL
jgi:hypothetical protein